MRLTDDQIKMARITYTKVVQDDFILDLIDTIEAQQQEIDRLKELLADKDEQMKRLEGGLKKLRSSFQWLSESIRDLGYRAWAEDNIDKIDALLGGAEDVIPRH